MAVRNVKTTQERRMAERDKEYVRPKRNKTNLPNSWDTQWIKVPKSWKDLYKKQCQYEDAQVKQSYQDTMQMSSDEIVDYKLHDGDCSWGCGEPMDYEQYHVWPDDKTKKEWLNGKTEDEHKQSLWDRWFNCE